jgi:2-polyprenyl-6-methoxyphenol hydroxylase-like FAD-dependent oxidoreductase
MRCDVLVIGGGPAGATAALLLSRQGFSVALLEKARFPRRKVCGEFVSAAGLAMLARLGLREQVASLAGPEIRRVALWMGKGACETKAPAPAGVAYARALERETLDTLLLEAAAQCGATIVQPARALGVRRLGASFLCHAIDEGARHTEITARAVIAAHGSWLPGALPTQPAPQASARADLLGFQAHFHGGEPHAGTIALVPFSGGYAGLVSRRGGGLTLACCIRRHALDEARRSFPGMPAGEAILHRLASMHAPLGRAVMAMTQDGPWLAAGPLRPGIRPASRGGVFAVGNAAAEAHPIAGEGIGMAMRSAFLLCAPLADALRAGCPAAAGEAVSAAYASRLRRAFAARIWLSSRFAELATDHPADGWLAALLLRAPALLYGAALLKGMDLAPRAPWPRLSAKRSSAA